VCLAASPKLKENAPSAVDAGAWRVLLLHAQTVDIRGVCCGKFEADHGAHRLAQLSAQARLSWPWHTWFDCNRHAQAPVLKRSSVSVFGLALLAEVRASASSRQ
jgi:hypothetical protein